MQIKKERCENIARQEYEECLRAALAWAVGLGIISAGAAAVGVGIGTHSSTLAILAAAAAGATAGLGTLLTMIHSCAVNHDKILKACDEEYEQGIRDLYKRAGIPYP